MACNFIPVKSTFQCKEDFSGVGSKFYVFDGSKITNAQWNLEDVSLIENFEAVIQGAIAGQELYEVEVKPKSGKVTSTNNPNGGGFSNVYTGVVAKNMQDMTELGRTLNNSSDWGILVPCSGGKYYVLFDKDFGIEFQMESDSGDAPDSDHGHTVTITCAPMLYAMPKISLNIDNGQVVSEKGFKAVVTFSAPSGTTITATDKNNSDAAVTSGSQVAVGHVILFKASKDVKWPDGSVGTNFVTVVDSNGVNVTATASA